MRGCGQRAAEYWTLPHWLTHIQSQHWRSIDLTLQRIARVWKNLHGKRSNLLIAVAGTNGKGSCVAMLDAVLQDAGVKVGAYTSPHLLTYNERIRINGQAVDDATLCQAFCEIEHARRAIPLTYFEFGTLCALLIFQQQRVDASILEVGMGGRLDAVNVVENDIALITSIGIDHTQWLGDRRDLIATEKAGILKQHSLAVCADPQPPPSIARIAAAQHCVLLQNGLDYQIEETDKLLTWKCQHAAVAPPWRCVEKLTPPFSGAAQRNNLGGVVATLALTQSHTGVTEKNLLRGLGKSKLMGRCQVIHGSPEIIVDVAHNPASVVILADFLAQRKVPGKTHGVFGILADKPSAQLLAAMRCVIDCWYFATLANGGHTAATLHQQWMRVGDAPAVCDESPSAAYLSAMAVAQVHDRIVVFGSFYTVGAILSYRAAARNCSDSMNYNHSR